MKAGSWLIGLISGACIMLAVYFAGERWKFTNEIKALKNDLDTKQASDRDEIEAIRAQFSKALRMCNAKLEATKAVK